MFIDRIESILACMLRLVIPVACALKWPQIASLFRRIYWRSCLGGLGRGCQLYSKIVIHSPESVTVGNNVSIAEFVHIWGDGGVAIGNRVMIASHCMITSQTHNISASARWENISKPINIGDNVWIGGGATILPGITIGKNSIIGAGSVVTHDIPANTLAMGVPARISRSIDE